MTEHFSWPLKSILHEFVYSVQPNVSIRVDEATELSLRAANKRQTWVPAGSGITRTFAAAASDWLILVPNAVAPSTWIETFGWTEYNLNGTKNKR